MILRRWIVEWLQDSRAAPVLEGIEGGFWSLFGGVIDAYRKGEESVTGTPESIDLVLSSGLTMVYIAAVIGILFFGMSVLTKIVEWVTGTRPGTMKKLVIATGMWIFGTLVETAATNRLFVWEMTKENAEWVYTARQIMTTSGIEAGTDIVAFGFFSDPNVEAFVMAVLALVVIANLVYAYLPITDSPIVVFSFLFAGFVVTSQALPYFGIELLPIDLRWIFPLHAIFALVIFGTALAWVFGKVFHGLYDFTKGEYGASDRPDKIKYFRDGTVMILFFLALIPFEYTATLGLLAWFSYKLALEKDVVYEFRSSSGTPEPAKEVGDQQWEQ